MSSTETIRGDLGEHKFTYEAKLRTLHINEPKGNDCPYDFVVDAGKGKLSRVQLKTSLSTEKGSDGYKINFTRGSKRNKRYTSDDCDILAVFIAPTQSFYFIPIEDLQVDTLRFYPNNLWKDRRNQSYRENWGIFINDD